MHGSHWKGGATALLATLAIVAIGQAQAPMDGGMMAPRTDLYTTYTEAFANPEACMPGAGGHAAMGVGGGPSNMAMFKTPPRYRIVTGGDYLYMGRSEPSNEILLRRNPLAIANARDPNNTAMQTDDFDYGNGRDGWRFMLGAELSMSDRVDVSYTRISRLSPVGILPSTVGVPAAGLVSAFNIPPNTQTGSQFGGIPANIVTFFPQNHRILTANATYTDEAYQAIDVVYRRNLDEFINSGLSWNIKWLIGLKFANTQERFQYFENVRNTAGASTGTFDYDLQVENMLMGPQVGVQATKRWCEVIEFDLNAKAGFMANFQTVNDNRLFLPVTGAPFNPIYEKDEAVTSGTFDMQLTTSIYPHQNVRIKGGIEMLMMSNMATATEQIDPNLRMRRRPGNKDDVLYFGLISGIEVRF